MAKMSAHSPYIVKLPMQALQNFFSTVQHECVQRPLKCTLKRSCVIILVTTQSFSRIQDKSNLRESSTIGASLLILHELIQYAYLSLFICTGHNIANCSQGWSLFTKEDTRGKKKQYKFIVNNSRIEGHFARKVILRTSICTFPSKLFVFRSLAGMIE